jgi:hypothetical protein
MNYRSTYHENLIGNINSSIISGSCRNSWKSINYYPLLKNMSSSVGSIIPNIWKVIKDVPNHQPDMVYWGKKHYRFPKWWIFH